jgi:hypothetical protein
VLQHVVELEFPYGFDAKDLEQMTVIGENKTQEGVSEVSLV